MRSGTVEQTAWDNGHRQTSLETVTAATDVTRRRYHVTSVPDKPRAEGVLELGPLLRFEQHYRDLTQPLRLLLIVGDSGHELLLTLPDLPSLIPS